MNFFNKKGVVIFFRFCWAAPEIRTDFGVHSVRPDMWIGRIIRSRQIAKCRALCENGHARRFLLYVLLINEARKEDRQAGKRHFNQTLRTVELWSRSNNYRHLKTKTYGIFLSPRCQCCRSNRFILSAYWYSEKMPCLDGASGPHLMLLGNAPLQSPLD